MNFSVGGTADRGFGTKTTQKRRAAAQEWFTHSLATASPSGTVTFGANSADYTQSPCRFGPDTPIPARLEPDETVVLSVISGTGYNVANPSAATGTILNDECTPPPWNMVSWWPADNNANDVAGPNNGTFAANTYAPGKVGQAFSFDGSTSVVSIPHAASLMPTVFTADAWIYPTPAGPGITRILEKGGYNGGSGGTGYGLTFNVANQSVQFEIWNGANHQDAVSTSSIPFNTWTHIAGTFDGSTSKIYVNGLLENSVSSVTMTPNTLPLTFGRAARGAFDFFTGEIDEVELFNRALSGPEIALLAEASGAGKCRTSTIQFAQANTDDVETDSGSHPVNIVVTRNGDLTGPADVTYTVTDGTATMADGDYSTPGTLHWDDGDSTPQNIVVTVFGDTKLEANETVNLTLSNAIGATLGTPNPATLTIVNDDAAPTLTISNRTANEGTPGATSSFTFTVTKTGSTDLSSTVNFATADDTGGANPATSGGACGVGVDYISQSGPLSFNAGDTSKPITILVCKDSTYEPNETFLVNLSSPTNATLGSPSQGVGTITNDDAPAGGFVVNSTADTNDGSCDNPLGTGSGNKDCTLREAINAANTSGSAVGISFAIPAGDPRHFYYKDDGSGSPNGTVTLANVATTTAANDAALAGG